MRNTPDAVAHGSRRATPNMAAMAQPLPRSRQSMLAQPCAALVLPTRPKVTDIYSIRATWGARVSMFTGSGADKAVPYIRLCVLTDAPSVSGLQVLIHDPWNQRRQTGLSSTCNTSLSCLSRRQTAVSSCLIPVASSPLARAQPLFAVLTPAFASGSYCAPCSPTTRLLARPLCLQPIATYCPRCSPEEPSVCLVARSDR